VPVHHLPSAVFPAEDSGDAQRIALQFPAQAGGGGAFDRGSDDADIRYWVSPEVR
jgi:hypothetical protein